jgi:hypothetical protein
MELALRPNLLHGVGGCDWVGRSALSGKPRPAPIDDEKATSPTKDLRFSGNYLVRASGAPCTFEPLSHSLLTYATRDGLVQARNASRAHPIRAKPCASYPLTHQ